MQKYKAKCKKCGHNNYVSKNTSIKSIKSHKPGERDKTEWSRYPDINFRCVKCNKKNNLQESRQLIGKE